MSTPVDVADISTWPPLGSIWQHYNGLQYRVLHYTNVGSLLAQYPVTVVHENVRTGKLFSRPLADWDRSLTAVG